VVGSWCWRRPVVHQRTSVLSEFNCSLFDRIQLEMIQMHSESLTENASTSTGRQDPYTWVSSAYKCGKYPFSSINDRPISYRTTVWLNQSLWIAYRREFNVASVVFEIADVTAAGGDIDMCKIQSLGELYMPAWRLILGTLQDRLPSTSVMWSERRNLKIICADAFSTDWSRRTR